MWMVGVEGAVGCACMGRAHVGGFWMGSVVEWVGVMGAWELGEYRKGVERGGRDVEK